jgi:hypothetical protein
MEARGLVRRLPGGVVPPGHVASVGRSAERGTRKLNDQLASAMPPRSIIVRTGRGDEEMIRVERASPTKPSSASNQFSVAFGRQMTSVTG